MNQKGVKFQELHILNFLKWIKKDLNGINNSMKVLFNTNFTFDVSLMEVGLAIIFKPKIYYLSNGNIFQLSDFIHEKKINLICSPVPNLIELLISKDIRKKRKFIITTFFIYSWFSIFIWFIK